jgi:branched-chain amino acid transport system permease protein
MAIYLQFIVLGLGLGAVYIGLSNALLLVYRATGIINFAQGAIAMWGAYVFARLRKDGTLVFPVGSFSFTDKPSVPVALLLGFVMALLLGLAVHWLVFRPVRSAPVLAQVVVSVALMLTMQALVVIRFGPNNIDIESLVPAESIAFLGARLSVGELVMAGVMLSLSALVWAYFRFTRWGVATRAAAENERGAMLMGFSPNALAALAMVMASLISTAGVIFGGTLTGLNPDNYTLLVVPALAVLLLARMRSIGGLAVASLGLGAFQSVLTLLASKPWWPVWARSGVEQVVPFLVIVVILLLFSKRLPSRGSLQLVRLPDVHIPRIRLVPASILLAGCIALLVFTSGPYRFGVTYSIIMMLLALSYVVVTGYLGQISLSQTAFAGAAGFALSKLTIFWTLPFPLAILLCAVVAGVLGMLVAMPAFRIRGAELAIVTIAAALAIERFIFANPSFTPAEGNPIASPSLWGFDLAMRAGANVSRIEFSLLVLAIACVVVWGFVRLASGETGRTFLAVRANERAAASAGIDPRRTKLIGFCLSAFIAGIAGCLMGYSAGQLSSASFTVFVGLQILSVAYLGGITSFGGAVVAGFIAPLGIIYVITNKLLQIEDYYALISGILLIATAIFNPQGIAGETRRQVEWVRQRLGRRAVSSKPVATAPSTRSGEAHAR